MTAHRGTNNKGAQLLDENGQLISDAAHPSPKDEAFSSGDDLSSSAPHLDSILNKINAIMAETPAERRQREASLVDAPGGQAEATLESGPAQQMDDGFVASEPMDLLAPYSAVLSDVRDYFKERHSLDPDDRLTHDVQPPLAGGFGQGFELGVEADLAGEEKAGEQAAFRGAEREAEKGFASGGDQLAALGGILQPDHSAVARAHNSAEVAAEFGSPGPGRVVTAEVMVSEQEEVQVFRHELMNRIGQLEQVISHHFGSQKSVAADAAKAAVALTMQSLDETPIGRRLAALEQAFENFKQADARAIEAGGRGIGEAATGQLGLPFADGGETNKQQQHEDHGRRETGAKPDRAYSDGQKPEIAIPDGVRPEGVGVGKSGVEPVAQRRGMMPPPPQPLVRERPKSEGKQGGAPLPPFAASLPEAKALSAGPGELPGDAPDALRADIAKDQKKEGPGAAARAPAPETGPMEQPGHLKQAKNPDEGKAASGDGSGQGDAQLSLSIKQLRAQFQKEAEQRFGAADEDRAGIDGLASGPHEAGDDDSALLYGKTDDQRGRFSLRGRAANDDLMPGEARRLARPAFIVATVALLLAAVGLSYGNKSFGETAGWQGWFESLPFIGDDGKADGRMLAKEKGEKQSGIEDAKVVGTKADLKDEELSITGNIEPRRLNGKSADRLSEEALDENITPESLLPMATGKLSLPPALIGPYSLRHDAANGKVEAQYEVARRYSLGLGVDVDFAEAVRWYMQAAAKGFAPAQYRLATFYERGRGVKRDLGKARLWYQRAAQLGNVKAMHNLAVITTAINRKKPDYQTSIYWFKQAAKYNLADSQFNLAILYLNGVGVRKNPVEAYRWFSLAARHGDREAAKRRDALEKNLKKTELLQASNILQAWKPLERDPVANEVGLKGFHVTSTMSHADETLERSRVLTAQILLRKLGYQVHNADGALNETTIAAIKKFEKDKGLPVTGKVTSGLIKVLNRSAL